MGKTTKAQLFPQEWARKSVAAQGTGILTPDSTRDKYSVIKKLSAAVSVSNKISKYIPIQEVLHLLYSSR